MLTVFLCQGRQLEADSMGSRNQCYKRLSMTRLLDNTSETVVFQFKLVSG